MNNSAQVSLPHGVVRSLRLEPARDSWRELIEAGLLRPLPPDRAVAVQVLDAGLLTQYPARPDRLRAADWALRGTCLARTSTPLLRLAALSFVVRTARGCNHGVAEMDLVAREWGVPAAVLPPLLEQLVIAGVLTTWQAALDTGELSWKLGPKGLHPCSVNQDTTQTPCNS